MCKDSSPPKGVVSGRVLGHRWHLHTCCRDNTPTVRLAVSPAKAVAEGPVIRLDECDQPMIRGTLTPCVIAHHRQANSRRRGIKGGAAARTGAISRAIPRRHLCMHVLELRCPRWATKPYSGCEGGLTPSNQGRRTNDNTRNSFLCGS